MSYVMGTITVPGSSTVTCFSAPPGYCNLLVYQPTQAQGVYLGTTNRVSVTNGMLITATPVNTEAYTGSGGITWFATTGNATAATFCYLLSSTN